MMKRILCLTCFLSLLSLCVLLKAEKAEKPTVPCGITVTGVTPVYASPSLTQEYYNGKVILLYYWNMNDPRMIKEISATFSQLNMLQQRGAGTGAFTVVGSYIGADATKASQFVRQCRVMFPVYQNLICQEAPPKPKQCSCVLMDSFGMVSAQGKVNDCMLSLGTSVEAAMNKKRMKSFPVPHPLDGMILEKKFAGLGLMLDPGKPWQGAYKKLEKACENPDADSTLMDIKSRIDDYIQTEVPKVCEMAQTKPAASFNALTLLAKSIKGLPGEETITETLKPIQADKTIAELSKVIVSIERFKAQVPGLKPIVAKNRSAVYVTQLQKFINKPALQDNVKAEAQALLDELSQLSTEAPVADAAPADDANADAPAEGE